MITEFRDNVAYIHYGTLLGHKRNKVLCLGTKWTQEGEDEQAPLTDSYQIPTVFTMGEPYLLHSLSPA